MINSLKKQEAQKQKYYNHVINKNQHISHKYASIEILKLIIFFQYKKIHTAVLGSHFSHAVLDIKCSSPLVGYYLRNQGALPATGFSLLLQHINIHKQPDKDCITFSEVIAKSKEHDKMVHTEFQKYSIGLNFCRKSSYFDRYYDILRAHMQKHQRQRQILSMEHST